ncbi:hypothetical protein BMF94_4826 [Rhodotorula taiwanensis]|uniref:Uncharacterized protein n=1 Tax=Rhodotorula taiwanensis TaxID=741276 RepID=A0A2S5B5Y9_9BASI|nr:hypothetical protein BMF94_4826 [Rhodotorula taiwanensis]
MAVEAHADEKAVAQYSEPPSAEEAQAALPEVPLVPCSDYRCQRLVNRAGDEFCNDYPRAASYHYHNADGSFYQKLANGYSYYNDGKGYNRIELNGVFVREYTIDRTRPIPRDESDESSVAPSTPPRVKPDPYPTPPPTGEQAPRVVKAENEDADDCLARSSASPPASLNAVKRRSRSPDADRGEHAAGPPQRAGLAFATPEPTPGLAVPNTLFNSPPASPEKPPATSEQTSRTLARGTPHEDGRRTNAELLMTPRRSERIQDNHGKSYNVSSSGSNNQGNHYCSRDYGNGSNSHENSNGSYYYSNSNGSTYYNNGKGPATYTSANGKSWTTR